MELEVNSSKYYEYKERQSIIQSYKCTIVYIMIQTNFNTENQFLKKKVKITVLVVNKSAMYLLKADFRVVKLEREQPLNLRHTMKATLVNVVAPFSDIGETNFDPIVIGYRSADRWKHHIIQPLG